MIEYSGHYVLALGGNNSAIGTTPLHLNEYKIEININVMSTTKCQLVISPPPIGISQQYSVITIPISITYVFYLSFYFLLFSLNS